MKVKTQTTDIRDVIIVTPEVFTDDRGFFTEVFRTDEFEAAGNLPTKFVQVNHSGSKRDIVRGLHFQWEPPMGKLMRVIIGEAFLVAVDIRKGSPTLGKWVGQKFNAKDRQLLWAPAGFARGFAVTSDYAEIEYLTTGTYNGKAESGILFNDPEIGIDWPVKYPILSMKDLNAQTLAQWLATEESNNFTY